MNQKALLCEWGAKGIRTVISIAPARFPNRGHRASFASRARD